MFGTQQSVLKYSLFQGCPFHCSTCTCTIVMNTYMYKLVFQPVTVVKSMLSQRSNGFNNLSKGHHASTEEWERGEVG